uniref:Pallidipin 2 n=1 Tax=Triatoma brasiliensis TaxID=65344 RepID=Q0MTD7_TRIBS|nr:pallidipin 2 [Triatoma brasiliensis]
MKLIIALTFLGILMCAFAEDCVLKPTCRQTFNSEQYFAIRHSYVTYSKNGPETKVCREYVTTKNTNGTTTTVYTIKDQTNPSGSNATCINTPKTGSNGQFSVTCTLSAGNEFQLTTSVVDTDHKTYVILQVCLNSGPGITDSGPGDILVLQTDKNVEIPAVTKYIQGNTGQWYSRKNSRC